VQKEILHGMQADFRQFVALRRSNAGERIERDGI